MVRNRLRCPRRMTDGAEQQTNQYQNPTGVRFPDVPVHHRLLLFVDPTQHHVAYSESVFIGMLHPGLIRLRLFNMPEHSADGRSRQRLISVRIRR